jgi:pSer/pThr/pTyr-binding forkhead associated (FHA) protein
MDVQLLIVQGKARGKYLRFSPGEFVFGRGPECHIRPNSEWVSGQHCLLRVTSDEASLRDLGSTNGALVNGARLVGERRLASGDQLQVGPLVLQVVLKGSPVGPELAPGESPLDRDTTVNLLRDTAEMHLPDA